jgi:4-hydroxy-2-oxoheptanedioate aldolase
MPNKLKQIWAGGGVVLNSWLHIPTGFSAELVAKAGWDSVTVDLQHGVQDYMSLVHCLQAIQPHSVVPLARVPSLEMGIVGKVLDAGALGVICPMINTAEQAEAFVSYCRYPPVGVRSNGPVRAGIYADGGIPGYQKVANQEILCMPMIETVEALGNLESILAVPGIDAVYVGPTDLCFSLGIAPKVDQEDPRLMEALSRIVEGAARCNIPACMHCLSPVYAKRMIAMGFKFVTVGWDSIFLGSAALAAVAAMRGN